MSPIVRPIFAAPLVLAAALAGSGCTPTCDTSDQEPTLYEGGTAVNGYYFSSSAHEKLLPFPGGKQYKIIHHLGFEPIQVQLYWSFAVGGIGTYEQTKDASTLSLAAGNSALIVLKNEEYILVQNDSCAEFWLLVVASGDPRPMDGGQPGVADAAAE